MMGSSRTLSPREGTLVSIHDERVGFVRNVKLEIARQSPTITGREVQDFHDHGLRAFNQAIFEGIQRELLVVTNGGKNTCPASVKSMPLVAVLAE